MHSGLIGTSHFLCCRHPFWSSKLCLVCYTGVRSGGKAGKENRPCVCGASRNDGLKNKSCFQGRERKVGGRLHYLYSHQNHDLGLAKMITSDENVNQSKIELQLTFLKIILLFKVYNIYMHIYICFYSYACKLNVFINPGLWEYE